MGSIPGGRRTLAAILIVIVAVSVTGISAYALMNTQRSSQQNYLLGLILFQMGQPRIVSCAPSIDEILCGLGLEEYIVGCTYQSDYPPGLMNLIAQGRIDNSLDWWSLNVETVVTLNPTIVLLDSGVSDQLLKYPSLISQGIPSFLVKRGESILEIKTSIFDVANIFGRISAAQTLVDAMDAKIQTIEGNVTGQERKNVLMIVWWMDTALTTCGNQTWISEMIQKAGGLNVYYDSGDPWPTVTVADAVAKGDAMGGIDIIVVTAMGIPSFDPAEIYESMATPPITTTDAWLHNEIYFFDYGQPDNLISRPGPRVAEGVELLAKVFFHAEVFNVSFPGTLYHVIDNYNYRDYLSSFILE